MPSALIASILAFLFASLFAGYLAYAEYIKEKTNWAKVFTLLFLFCGLLFWGVIDKLHTYYDAQSSTTVIISSDSLNAVKTQTLVDSSAIVMDSGFKNTDSAIRKIPEQVAKRLPSTLLPPFLEVASLVGDPDPAVERTTTDTMYRIVYTVTNLREQEAYVSLEKTATIIFANGKPTIHSHLINKPQNPLIYFSKSLAKPTRFMTYFYSDCDKLVASTDTVYFCFKLEYADKNGAIQRPLERVYPFHCGQIGVSLPQETGHFDEIKKLLVSKKYW